MASLRGSGLLQPGGVATTLVASGQQWDWPNAWPPLQQMLVEGLAGCGAAGGAVLAEELALCWLRSNHRGWSRDGVMREKYDATRPGESGGGGEYAPQVCLSLAYHNVRWRPYRGLGCVALHAHTLRTRYGFIRRTASVGPTAWRCGCSNATRRASRASCARTVSTVTWLTNSARHAWTYRYRATYRATASYYSGQRRPCVSRVPFRKLI